MHAMSYSLCRSIIAARRSSARRTSRPRSQLGANWEQYCQYGSTMVTIRMPRRFRRIQRLFLNLQQERGVCPIRSKRGRTRFRSWSL